MPAQSRDSKGPGSESEPGPLAIWRSGRVSAGSLLGSRLRLSGGLWRGSCRGWLMASRAAIGREGGVVRRERLHLVRAVTEGAVLVRIAFDRMRDCLGRSGGRCCAAIGCCRLVTRCAAIRGKAGVIRRGRLHLVRAVTRRAVLVRVPFDRMRDRLGAARHGCLACLRRSTGCCRLMTRCAAIRGKAGVIRRGRLHLVRAVARRAVLVRFAVDRVRDRLGAAGRGCLAGLRRGAGFRCGAVCGWFVASCAAIGGETGVIRRERLDLVRAVARRAVLVRVAFDRCGIAFGPPALRVAAACRAVSARLMTNLARFYRPALVVGRHRLHAAGGMTGEALLLAGNRVRDRHAEAAALGRGR